MNGKDFRSEKDWLQGLVREGWRMELLISGFSLVLLMRVPGKISYWQDYIDIHLYFQDGMETLIIFFLSILSLASKVLIVNLLANIFLRGFWIGTIGLNSVQDRIKIEELGYSRRFIDYLNARVMPLDRLTQRLDEICSVIFSFSFLIVFMLISFFLYLLYAISINYILLKLSVSESGTMQWLAGHFGVIIVILLILIGLIYLMDTLTLGALKRIKIFSRIYLRIYRFVSGVTLSFVYRSIYYSLITRFSGRQVVLFMVPYLIFLIGNSFWKYDQYLLFPADQNETNWQTNVYDDQRPSDTFIQKASIPTAWAAQEFLPLFIRYELAHNPDIREYCGLDMEISPLSVGRGASSIFVDSSRLIDPGDKVRSMDCLLDYYKVSVDGMAIFSDTVKSARSAAFWYIHPVNEERGLRIILDIDTLAHGQHWISIDRPVRNDSDEWIDRSYIRFPFWKQ